MTDGILEWRNNQKEQMSTRERQKYDSDQLLQKDMKRHYDSRLK